MNRRTVIRNVLFISGGAIILPACLQNDKSLLNLKNISISGRQEQMLAELAEAIIPKSSDSIGAKDLKTHEFILTMIDDCSGPEEQRNYEKGMKVFEELCQKKWDSSFLKCSPEQRIRLLETLDGKNDSKDEAVLFYNTTKRLALENYLTSEFYMTKADGYNIIPEKYRGCISVIST